MQLGGGRVHEVCVCVGGDLTHGICLFVLLQDVLCVYTCIGVCMGSVCVCVCVGKQICTYLML